MLERNNRYLCYKNLKENYLKVKKNSHFVSELIQNENKEYRI